MAKKVNTMNPLSWPAETWYFWLSWLAIGFVGLSVMTSFGALYASRAVNRRQTEQVLKLEAANIAAQRELEAERKTRLEMEVDVAPRLIPLIDHGGVTNIDDLKPYTGTELVIEYAPDSEAQTAAKNIQDVTQAAGWKLTKADCPSDLIGFNDGVDGVVVTPYRPDNPDPTPDELRSKRAAEALVAFLELNKWKARLSGGHRGELSPNAVKVQVGFKPMPYFLKPMIDAVKERYEKDSRKNPYRLK
jgi:hypothetical protein